MNGQTNFMAIILRKDNPRLQQAFDEFDETVAFLFDWAGGLVGYDWRSASQGMAIRSATATEGCERVCRWFIFYISTRDLEFGEWDKWR